MNDLISRQVAIDALERRKDKTAKGEIGSFYNTIIQHDIDVIVELLSADVQPVRHGHWLRTGRTNVYGGFEVECSVCNDNVMITNIEYEHYCRNCGARMDERSE